MLHAMPTMHTSAARVQSHRAGCRSSLSIATSCRPRRSLVARVTAFKEDSVSSESTRKVLRDLLARPKPTRKSGGYAVMHEKESLQPWQFEMPAQLSPNEIDIVVTHNGVCHSDLHMQNDDWGISAYPFIPGHEVVGIVRAVGSQVSTLQPGMRVGVGWIKTSCRRCAACIRGEENLCAKGYTGLITNGGNGGFQAVLRVPADFTYNIPDALESGYAAPLLCAGITVFAPLKKYMNRPGMKVAVLGVGGLGHLALQFAHVMGGLVTAIDVSEDKRGEAHSLGAQAFDVFSQDVSTRHPSEFDIILNCASANIPVGPLMAMLANDGTLVQIGIPGGKAALTVPITDLVFGQKRVAGSIVGGRSDMQTMLDLAASKGVKPLIEVMPSNKINDAFARVASGKARYRVVLEMDLAGDSALSVQD